MKPMIGSPALRCSVLFLLGALVGVPLATALIGPIISDTPLLEEPLVVGFESLSSGSVLLFRHESDSRLTSVESSGDSFIIPAQQLSRYGSYVFTVHVDGVVYPDVGAYRFFLAPSSNTYTEIYEAYALNDSIGSYCRPHNGEFQCRVESFQALEIERFSRLYARTGDAAFAAIIDSLIEAPWAQSMSPNHCRPDLNDFDCSDVTVLLTNYAGAERQGILIGSLWRAYRNIGDDRILSLATNFSNGIAGNCNVWAGSYDCGSVKNQALMIEGYAEAYYTTRNDTYRRIAANLTEVLVDQYDFDDPYYLHGLTAAYRVLGSRDPSLEGHIADFLKENRMLCVNAACSRLDEYVLHGALHHVSEFGPRIHLDLSDEHSVPLRRFAREAAYDLLSSQEGPCTNSGASYICSNPQLQSYATRSFDLESTRSVFFNRTIYGVRMLQEPRVDQNLTLSFRFLGELENRTLEIKDTLDTEYVHVPIAADGTAVVPEELLEYSGFLEYRIRASDLVFPSSGTYKLSIGQEYLFLEELLEELVTSDPLNFCAPNDPESPTRYACRYEYMQGAYIGALSTGDAALPQRDLTAMIDGLASTRPETTSFYSSCDPHRDDYSCSFTAGLILDVRRRQGSYRLGNLVWGFSSSYTDTLNHTYLDFASTLLYETPEECDYLNGDYACGDNRSLAALIRGFSMYLSIVDDTVLSFHHRGLIGEAIDRGIEDVHLFRAVLGSYLMDPRIEDTFPVLAAIEAAVDAGVLDTCIEPQSCDIERAYLSIESAWKSYLLLERSSLFDTASALLFVRPASSGGYCYPTSTDPALEDIRTICEFPNEQASMIQGYASALRNFVSRDIPEFDIVVSGPQTASYLSVENYTCTISNTGLVNISDAQVGITSNQDSTILTTSIEGNGTSQIIQQRVAVTNLTPGSNLTVSFELSMIGGGRDEIRCTLLTQSARYPIVVDNIGPVLTITPHPSQSSYESLGFIVVLNLTHDRFFSLENVTLLISSDFPLKDSPNASGSSLNITKTIDLIGPFSTVQESFALIPSDETPVNITITGNASFGATITQNFTVQPIFDSIISTVSLPPEIVVYRENTFVVSVMNNRTSPLADFTIGASTRPNETVLPESSDTFDIVGERFVKTLAPMESGSAMFTVFPNSSSIGETIDVIVSLTTPEGFNVTRTVSVPVSYEVFSFEADVPYLEREGSFDISIENTARVALSNVHFANASGSRIRIKGIVPQPIVEPFNSVIESFTVLDNGSNDITDSILDPTIMTVFPDHANLTILIEAPNHIYASTIVFGGEYELPENQSVFLTDMNDTVLCQFTSSGCSFDTDTYLNGTVLMLRYEGSEDFTISVLNLTVSGENRTFRADRTPEGVFRIPTIEPEELLVFTLAYEQVSSDASSFESALENHAIELSVISEENATGLFSAVLEPAPPASSGGSGPSSPGGGFTGGSSDSDPDPITITYPIEESFVRSEYHSRGLVGYHEPTLKIPDDLAGPLSCLLITKRFEYSNRTWSVLTSFSADGCLDGIDRVLVYFVEQPFVHDGPSPTTFRAEELLSAGISYTFSEEDRSLDAVLEDARSSVIVVPLVDLPESASPKPYSPTQIQPRSLFALLRDLSFLRELATRVFSFILVVVATVIGLALITIVAVSWATKQNPFALLLWIKRSTKRFFIGRRYERFRINAPLEEEHQELYFKLKSAAVHAASGEIHEAHRSLMEARELFGSLPLSGSDDGVKYSSLVARELDRISEKILSSKALKKGSEKHTSTPVPDQLEEAYFQLKLASIYSLSGEVDEAHRSLMEARELFGSLSFSGSDDGVKYSSLVARELDRISELIAKKRSEKRMRRASEPTKTGSEHAVSDGPKQAALAMDEEVLAEHDCLMSIYRANTLADELRFEQARDLLERTKREVEELDPLEKPGERAFLLSRIEAVEEDIEARIEKSFPIRVMLAMQKKWAALTERFANKNA